MGWRLSEVDDRETPVAQTYTTVQEVAVIIGTRWTMDSLSRKRDFSETFFSLSKLNNAANSTQSVLRQGI